MKYNKEIKLGIFAIAAFIMLYAGINYLRGTPIITGQSTYYVIFSETDGLAKSSPVLYKGYKVGLVKKIVFDQQNDRIVAAVAISNDFKIPKLAEISINSDGLLGGKVIELRGPPNTEGYFLNGDTLEGTNQNSLSETLAKELLPMKDNFQSFLINLDSISIQLNKLLNNGSIQNTIANLEETSKSINGILASEKDQMHAIFANVKRITENLDNNSEKLNVIFDNLEKVSDSLAKVELVSTIAHAKRTLEQTEITMNKINNGEGSLGLLVNNKELYNNLNQSAANLDKLMLDLRTNPSRYVHFSLFGRKK